MAVTTTNSANSQYRLLTGGTIQETLDAMESTSFSGFVQFGHDGTNYFALYRL